MKNRKVFICLILLVSSFMISCKWQLPERVSVKSNADYNFSAGNLKMPFDEYLDIKKVMEKGDLPASVKVYDYFPGQKDPNTQRYLIKVALAEIPLDLDGIMSQIKLEEHLKAMEFNKSFTIPNLNIPSIERAIDTNGQSGTLPIAVNLNPAPIKFSIDDILPANSGIDSIDISEGSLEVKITGINGDANYSVNLVSTGGLTITGGTSNNGGSISLNNTTLKSGKTDISVTLNITGLKTVNSPKIVITPVFKKLKSATVDIGSDVKPSFESSVLFPEETKNSINSVVLEPSGFKLTYTNTIPASNAISLSVKSEFLGLDGGSSGDKVIAFENGTGKTVDVLSQEKVVQIDQNSKIDFKANLVVNSSTAQNSKLTIKDIELGKTYSIGMKLEPVLEWKSITLNPKALENLKIDKKTVDLGLDLNKIFVDFGTNLGVPDLYSKIKISDLPVYIFCGKPQGLAGLDNLKISGSAKLLVGKEEIGDLLTETDNIGFVKLPDFENKVIVTQDMKELKQSVTRNLGDAFNTAIKTAGNLNLKYSITAKGGVGDPVIINKADLKETNKIALEAYIDLGLALNIPGDSEGIKIDLKNLNTFKEVLKTDRDILNGAGKSIKEQGNDAYLTAVKNISVRCDVAALPIATKQPIKFLMQSNVGDWNLNLGQGHSLDIALTKQQIESLFNDKEKNPNCEFKISKMEVTLPVGDFSVPRGKKVDTNLYLNLATDGTVKVWEKGGNK